MTSSSSLIEGKNNHARRTRDWHKAMPAPDACVAFLEGMFHDSALYEDEAKVQLPHVRAMLSDDRESLRLAAAIAPRGEETSEPLLPWTTPLTAILPQLLAMVELERQYKETERTPEAEEALQFAHERLSWALEYARQEARLLRDHPHSQVREALDASMTQEMVTPQLATPDMPPLGFYKGFSQEAHRAFLQNPVTRDMAAEGTRLLYTTAWLGAVHESHAKLTDEAKENLEIAQRMVHARVLLTVQLFLCNHLVAWACSTC